MAFIPVPGCLKVALTYQAASTDAAQVMHIARVSGSTAAWSLTELNAILSAFNTPWRAQVLPTMNINAALTEVRITDLTTVTGLQVVNTGVTNGGNNSNQLPDQDAILLKINTALRGRSYRGRTYLPYFSVNDMTNTGDVIGTKITALQTAFTAVRSSLMGAAPASDFCIASRYSGTNKTIPGHRPVPIPRASGIFTMMSTYAIEPNFATQRRRRATN